MSENSKFETFANKLSVFECKFERVCAGIGTSIKEPTFDQVDITLLQELLALAFTEFANFQNELMTLDDPDMEEKRINSICRVRRLSDLD